MQKHPKLVFILLYAVALLCDSVSAVELESADKVALLFRAESLYGYSKVSEGSGDFSTSNNWLASGAFAWDEQTSIIGAYNGSFEQSQIFIAQEEGGRESNQVMTHNLSLAAKRAVSDTFSIRPQIFYNWNYIKETSDEDLGNGLYDYEDFGGGLENTHILFNNDIYPLQLEYGYTLYERSYPNYTSILLIVPGASAEEFEKDYVGHKADISVSRYIVEKLWGQVNYTFLFKRFINKREIDVNGLLLDDHRRDFFNHLEGTLLRTITDWLSFRFRSGIQVNRSNLDYYDTNNTLTLADDRFYEEFYDYTQYHIGPEFDFFWTGPFTEQHKTNLSIGYDFRHTQYPGRQKQDASRNLLGGDQEDDAHTLYARLTIPVNEEWSWISRASYTDQSSNQKYERFYRYNYEVWQLLSGLSFEY